MLPALFAALWFASWQATAPAAGNYARETVAVGKVEREYRLYAPRSLDLSKPAPLVVAFHGMLLDSKDFMPHYTRLNEAAEAHKFLLAYPQAMDRSWGLLPAKVEADLAFFDALVRDVSGHFKVDTDRIYVLGMSNGGYFAHLVGKERSKKVAAVASHSGPLGLQTLGGIRAERKFPVLIIHGDEDGILPVAWARENRDKYRKEGHEVEYLELEGVGHVWGTKQKVNDTIWRFFDKHPLGKPDTPSPARKGKR